MHRNEYRRMAHEEVEEIFREILPQAGMKVREEQITLCHQMLSSLCGNKIALCDAAVGVGTRIIFSSARLSGAASSVN